MSNIASIAPEIKARDTNARVGRNVQYVMRERGVNQTQLARSLDLTDSQVSRRIAGKVDWTPEDLETAARVLQVDVGLLFTLKLPGLDSNQEPIG